MKYKNALLSFVMLTLQLVATEVRAEQDLYDETLSSCLGFYGEELVNNMADPTGLWTRRMGVTIPSTALARRLQSESMNLNFFATRLPFARPEFIEAINDCRSELVKNSSNSRRAQMEANLHIEEFYSELKGAVVNAYVGQLQITAATMVAIDLALARYLSARLYSFVNKAFLAALGGAVAHLSIFVYCTNFTDSAQRDILQILDEEALLRLRISIQENSINTVETLLSRTNHTDNNWQSYTSRDISKCCGSWS